MKVHNYNNYDTMKHTLLNPSLEDEAIDNSSQKLNLLLHMNER